MAAATPLGGCGDGDRPAGAERAAARAVTALQRAFAAADRAGMCRLMSATARRQAGAVAHGQRDDCPADLQEAFAVIDAGGGMRTPPRVRVADVDLRGPRATATVGSRRFGPVAVPLVRGRRTWRMATFFGTPPGEAVGLLDRRRETQSVPDPPAARVAVAERSGFPCLPLVADGYPAIGGGCELRASARRIRVTIGTAFGHFRFGECDLTYRVLVDGRGKAWTDSVALSGPDTANNGCADVRACENERREPLPWRGAIVPAGRPGHFLHRMTACLDTCIGFYAGTLTIELDAAGGLRARAKGSTVGGSGLRFDGPIDVRSSDISIRTIARDSSRP